MDLWERPGSLREARRHRGGQSKGKHMTESEQH